MLLFFTKSPGSLMKDAPQTTTMAELVADRDSTHREAPQASAAQLILLLRSNYTDIGTKIFTENERNYTDTDLELLELLACELFFQKQLVSYLEELIQNLSQELHKVENKIVYIPKPKPELLRSHPSICATMDMIDYILY